MTETRDAGATVRDLVELRIHGVSGTSREALLEHNDAVQVAGDGRSGFHRRRGWHAYGPAEAVGAVGPVRRHLEAFSWGGLTSGAASRAAWLLLLPFALVNVAAWATPGADPAAPRALRSDPAAPWNGWSQRLLLRMLRVFALTLTLGFVTSAVTVGMDLVGRQCTADIDRCYAGRENWFRDILEWLAGRAPGTRLGLTVLVPLLAVSGLWALAGKSYRVYEKAGADEGTGYVDGRRSPFALRTFWRRNESVARLRALHVAAAYATVAALTAQSLRPGRLSDSLTAASYAVVAACLALLLVSRTADLGDELLGREVWWPAQVLPRVLCYTAIGLVVAAAWGAFAGVPEPIPGDVLPGHGDALEWTARVQGTSGVLVLLLTLMHRPWRGPEPRPFLWGFLTPALCALAALTAAVLSTGVVYRAADVLGTPVTVPGTKPETMDLVLHPTYPWLSVLTALYVPALVLALLVVALYTAFRTWRISATWTQPVCEDYGIDPDTAPAGTRTRVREVAQARRVASLTERGPRVLAAVGVSASLLGPVAWWFDRRYGGPPKKVLWWERAAVEGFGADAIVAVMLGLLALALLAYRKDGMRRTVGILWDLSTFWPRAAHPLAPPCYCERVVPQLTTRLNGLARADTRVLLSAHSQGSVIAAAAVLQLPRRTLGRMALVTHGSPLKRLYSRAFPAYFHAALFACCRDELLTGPGDAPGRWRNCWRETDYLGRWVFDEENDVDVPVEDPPAHPRPRECDETDAPLHAALGDIVAPAPLRHSNYYLSVEYDRVVQELDGLLGAPPSPPHGEPDRRYAAMGGGRAPTGEEVEQAPPL